MTFVVKMLRMNVASYGNGRCTFYGMMKNWIVSLEKPIPERWQNMIACNGSLFNIEAYDLSVANLCRIHAEALNLMLNNGNYRAIAEKMVRVLDEDVNAFGLVSNVMAAVNCRFGGTPVLVKFEKFVEEVEEFGVWLRTWCGIDLEGISKQLYGMEDAVGAALDEKFTNSNGEAVWRG